LAIEGFDGALVDEVELGVGAGDDVVVAAGLQGAHDGGAGEASVSGDVDF